MGLLSRFFHQRLLRRLGAPELVWDICSTAGDVALMDGVGSIWGCDIDAIKDSDLVIIWGANVAYSSIHAYTWLNRLVKSLSSIQSKHQQQNHFSMFQ